MWNMYVFVINLIAINNMETKFIIYLKYISEEIYLELKCDKFFMVVKPQNFAKSY